MRDMRENMKRLSDVEKAKLMLQILLVKKEIDVYDVMIQFDISYTRAIPVFKLTRRLCEKQGICYYDEKEHKLKLVEGKIDQKEQEEMEEIKKILDAKPLTSQEQK